MKILLNSDIPIYKQISADFKERIMNGTISAGEYLPSIRGLAKELKISVITTMKAYEELCSEGLVSAVQGKGYIVNAQDTGICDFLNSICRTHSTVQGLRGYPLTRYARC